MMTKSKSKALTNRFDYVCHAVVRELHLQSYAGDQPLDFQSVIVVLQGVTALIRSAIEFGRGEDGRAFFTQMFKSISRKENLGRGIQDDSDVKRSLRFAVILIAGWCVRTLREVKDTPDTAETRAALGVFQECVQHTHGLEDLIRLWEEERATDYIPNRTRCGLSAMLRIEDWDHTPGRSIRPGFSVTYSPDTSWVFDGLLALLATQQPSFQRIKDGLEGIHESIAKWPTEIWDVKRIRERLGSLITLGWLKGLVSDPERRLQQIADRMEERAKESRLQKLAIIVNSPIAIAMFEKLAKDVLGHLKSVESKRKDKVLRNLGIGSTAKIETATLPIIIRWALDKQDFNESAPQASGLAEIIADDLVDRVAFQLFALAENAVQAEGPPLTEIAAIPRRIESIASELRRTGFSPNLVAIPMEDEFRRALFGERYWDAPGARRLGSSHVGQFAGMEVVFWPYSNPRSIMVADTHNLFAESTELSLEKRLMIKPPIVDSDSHVKLLNAARAAHTAGEVPDTREIKVTVEFALVPQIRISNPAAGRRIDLSPTFLAAMDQSPG
jgi:hypothetical protein